MERHDTHALSCSSSEEHSYQFDKNISTKNISSENELYSKEEEKNDWSNIIINNFKEMKNTMGIQGDSFNLNDISNQEKEEKNKNENKSKNKDKNKDKSRDKKFIKKKEILKNKSKDKKIDIIKEKNKSQTKNNSPINKKKEISSKNQKIEKNEKFEKNEKNEKKEKKVQKLEKFTVLDNGIVMKRINQQNSPDENNIINERKMKMMKENIIKEYLSHYDKNQKPPMIIKKPNRSFITKKYIYKSKRKDRFKKKNYIKKKTYSNSHTASYGNYYKLTAKSRKSTSSSAKPNTKRQIEKSKTILANRNPNNNLGKLEDKFSSLSTITAKKFSINNNSNLFFNSSNNNKNFMQKRPLSSFNVIRKEIDINLKSSKIDYSFYNKSFNIQKTCQISSITNLNSNIKNNNIINNNNRKKIIYENKNFFNELKDLKNAFELSDNNIMINNNTNKFNNEINIIDNNFSERINKKAFLKHNSESNINKDALLIKKRTLNSAKVRGKSYNYFYPKDPSPLFVEFNNKQNINNEIQKEDNNVCKKCRFKKHFGCEKNCPICINMKEKNKLKEKKLSNISYYFPFKDKNNNNSIQNSFRSNNNSNNSEKIKQIINHDSFINFINIKMENLVPMDYYYNPFYLNSIHTTLNKKKKNKFICAKQIRNEKNKNKISHKYNALQNYFD